jgi:hypothetical protein
MQPNSTYLTVAIVWIGLLNPLATVDDILALPRLGEPPVQTTENIELGDDQIIANLAALNPMEYGRIRV